MAVSRKEPLQTTAEVIEVLGGLSAVSDLTGARYKLVSGWGKEATFPSRYFAVMDWALRRRRYRAHPSLWGQVTVPEMEKEAA